MAQRNSVGRNRPNKFPLTLHPTGQSCKKIGGKLHHFGSDRQKALERYFEQAACLHSGKAPKTTGPTDNISLKMLRNPLLCPTELQAHAGAS